MVDFNPLSRGLRCELLEFRHDTPAVRRNEQRQSRTRSSDFPNLTEHSTPAPPLRQHLHLDSRFGESSFSASHHFRVRARSTSHPNAHSSRIDICIRLAATQELRLHGRKIFFVPPPNTVWPLAANPTTRTRCPARVLVVLSWP